jgi:putative flippase GtrA
MTVRQIIDRIPVGRMLRCGAASIATTLLSLSVLAFLVTFGVGAARANILATLVGIGPSYALNRRWAWAGRSDGHRWRELLPFWVLSITGLVLSTIAVHVADGFAARHGLTSSIRTGFLLSANLGTFGLLWLVQFAILDRLVFNRQPTQELV